MDMKWDLTRGSKVRIGRKLSLGSRKIMPVGHGSKDIAAALGTRCEIT